MGNFKIIKLLFVVIFLATSLVAQTNSLKKKNVSILPFTAKGVSSVEAEGMSDLFSVELENIKKYTILDRANMQQILDEQSFQNRGCTDSACAVQIGKLLNMDYMFTGSVIKLGDKMYLTVNIIDIESGQVKKSAKSEGFTFDTMDSEVKRLVSMITGVTMSAYKKSKRENLLKIKKRKKGFFLSGLGFGLIGGIANILAYADNKAVSDAAELYNTADDETATEKWNDYDSKYTTQQIKYGVTFASYGVGLVLTIIGLTKKTEDKTAVSFTPYFLEERSGFILTYNF